MRNGENCNVFLRTGYFFDWYFSEVIKDSLRWSICLNICQLVLLNKLLIHIEILIKIKILDLRNSTSISNVCYFEPIGMCGQVS